MFPSSRNTNSSANYNQYHPFPSSSSRSLTTHDHDYDHTMPRAGTGTGTSFTGDKNCSNGSISLLVQEDPVPVPNAPPFWHFPPVSSFVPDDDDDDNGLLMSHLLSQPQHQFLGSTTNTNPNPNTNVAPPPDSPAAAAAAASRVKDTVASKKVGSSSSSSKRKSNGKKQQGIPRKRSSGKKDRHSKIYTAHGPRDRRMRLSLQIARKFFDLQDTLGFDKASKTIDWLFSKSKAAIKELTDNLNLPARGVKPSFSTGGDKSVSSTSESEVLSSSAAAKEWENMDNNNNIMTVGEQQGVIATSSVLVDESTTTRRPRGRGRGRGRDDESTITAKERKSRKASFNPPPPPPVARESRDKARARARERTREKLEMIMMMRSTSRELDTSNKYYCPSPSDHHDESNPNCHELLERLQSPSSSSGDQNLGPSNHRPNSYNLKVVAEEVEEPHQSTSTTYVDDSQSLLQHQMDSVSIIEKFLGISTRLPPPSSLMFNYSSSRENPDIANANFPANWGIINNVDRIQHGYSANIKEPTGIAQEPNPSSITMMMDPNIAALSSPGQGQGDNPYSPINVTVSSYAKIVLNHNSDLMW